MNRKEVEDFYWPHIETRFFEGYVLLYFTLIFVGLVYTKVYLFYASIPLLLLNIHSCREQDTTLLNSITFSWFIICMLTFLRYCNVSLLRLS